jgi:periplasmic copper chaperone A
MTKLLLAFVLAAAAQVQAQTAAAPVVVDGAWARVLLQGQASSGAYMTFTAREPLTLTGAESPAAGIIEIHQMKMEGDVMKMRAVDTLDLPAGRAVELKPGGYHFMLMDLKAAFRAGTRIPMTLQFRDVKGKQRALQVSVPVAAAAPAPHKP